MHPKGENQHLLLPVSPIMRLRPGCQVLATLKLPSAWVQWASIQGTFWSEVEPMKKTQTGTSSIMSLALLLMGLTAFEAQASRVRGGVTLKPLNAGMVDDVLESSNGATHATIDFVNQRRGAVDIYWINYDGHRVLYVAGLAAGSTCTYSLLS
jgi:hypothetical protein